MPNICQKLIVTGEQTGVLCESGKRKASVSLTKPTPYYLYYQRDTVSDDIFALSTAPLAFNFIEDNLSQTQALWGHFEIFVITDILHILFE